MTSGGNLARWVTQPTSIWRSAIGSGAILAIWLYANRSSLYWFDQTFRDLSLFNWLLLGVGVLLLLALGIRHRRHFDYPAVLALRPVPLLLMVGCGIGAIALRWLIAFEQVPAVLFLLGTYGLLGLVLAEPVWRRGLPVAAAIAGVLPFWIQFYTGLGFPARILTAHAVEAILAIWNLPALSSEDIIVLDTGIAHVDLPCSGLKSLWVGTLVLLGATWIEGRQIGWRWMLVCLTHLGLLVVANIGRVLTLVLLALVWQRSDLAEVLHVPIGLVSFITVCLLSWGLLRLVPQRQDHTPRRGQVVQPPVGRRPNRWWSIACVLGLVGLACLPLPAQRSIDPLSFSDLEWEAPIQMQAVPLSEIEQNFFTTYPDVVAEEQRFEADGISGTLLLVSSPTWQAHHSPELCYVSSGFQLNHMEQQQLTPDVLGRWLTLNQGTRSATYWFQSPHHTTDDYLTRMVAEITRQEPNWTLVSILFDQAYSPDQSPVQSFLTSVHHTLDRHWQGVHA